MLKIVNLTKKFGNKQALDNINVSFCNGVTGLLGPNGAGKTTLMRILATIDKPSGGTVFWNGEDIQKKTNGVAQSSGIFATGLWGVPKYECNRISGIYCSNEKS